MARESFKLSATNCGTGGLAAEQTILRPWDWDSVLANMQQALSPMRQAPLYGKSESMGGSLALRIRQTSKKCACRHPAVDRYPPLVSRAMALGFMRILYEKLFNFKKIWQ